MLSGEQVDRWCGDRAADYRKLERIKGHPSAWGGGDPLTQGIVWAILSLADGNCPESGEVLEYIRAVRRDGGVLPSGEFLPPAPL